MLRNIRNSKITTSTGLILLILIVLRVTFGFNFFDNFDLSELAAGISSIYLFFAKDHNK